MSHPGHSLLQPVLTQHRISLSLAAVGPSAEAGPAAKDFTVWGDRPVGSENRGQEAVRQRRA